jgi:PAS domain S-box-containing protein
VIFPGVTLALIAAAVLALGAAYSAIKHRRESVTDLVNRLMVLFALWAVLYAFEIATSSEYAKVWWARFEYLSIASIPVFWFLFALAYSGEGKRISRRSVVLLSVIPFITLVMAFASGYHSLLWAEINLIETAGLTLLDPTYGPWFVVHVVYSYALMLIGSSMLLVESYRTHSEFKKRTYLIVFAALAPLVANAISLSPGNPWPGLDLTPFAFIVTGAAIIWGLLGFRLLEIAPVARRSIVEAMEEGVLVLDTEGLVVDANPSALRILSAQGEDLMDSPPPPSLRGWTDYGQPTPGTNEERVAVTLGPTGRMYDVLHEQLSEPDGKHIGTLILLRDVTDYRRSLEATRQSEERFRELFDQSPVGTHELDLDGVVTRVNKTELEMFGYQENELVGRYTWDLVVDGDSDRRVLEQAVRAGKVLDEVVERDYLRRDGSTFTAMGKSIALYDADGRHTGFRTTVQDISELKSAERELRKVVHHSEVVSEIGYVVSSSLDIDQVYARFADLVSQVIPWDRLVVTLKDDESGMVTRAFVAGLEVPGWEAGARHNIDQTIYVEEGLSERGYLVVGDRMFELAGRVPGVLDVYEQGIKSVLGVPLISDDLVIGEVSFGSLSPEAYEEPDLEMAKRMASQLSGAIVNARLHSDLGKESAERDVLAAIGRVMSSTFEVDEVYDQFAEQVGRLLSFDRLNIVEVNARKGEITNVYVTGIDVPGLGVGSSSIIDDSSSARSLLTGSEGEVMTGEEQGRLVETSSVEAANQAVGLLSKIAVPVVSEDEVVGVLNIRSRDPQAYSDEHLRIVRRVCTQIAGAVSNAQRHRRLTEAQVALRESEERFRQMFHESPIAVSVIGLDSRFVRVNPAFSTLLSFDEEEMVGNSYLDFTHPEDREMSEEIAEELFEGDESAKSFEKRFLAKDGTTVWAGVTTTVVHDDAGQPIYVLGMVEDISERKKSEQIERMYRYRLEIHANEMSERYREAERLREELEQENRSRLRFLNVLSHELRTPLTPIISSGELLQERVAADPNAVKLLANVLAGASTLRDRIDDLLDVAAFQSGTYLLDKKSVAIGGLIQEACDLLAPEASRKNQAIEVEIGSKLPRLNADGGRLKQVVINLVSNALKFGYPGATVHVSASADDFTVSLQVSDKGMGIAEDEQAKLFEPYFRTEQDRQRFPGLGLGLAVSKQIVEAHGGHITVESTLGVGSTFTAIFPLPGRMQKSRKTVK